MMTDRLKRRVSKAIKHFWLTREGQLLAQGKRSGKQDQGRRGAATGGKQLDGFVALIRGLLAEAGLPDHSVFTKSGKIVLPGFFRPTKEWDLLVVADDNLLASIEFKSHVGPSFGNNYNNRTEEALGSATDMWTASREGAFGPSIRPWLGYFMLLEEADGSTRPVRTSSPHFDVFPEFNGASYADRYELLCVRLVRERLYDSACLLLSDRHGGKKGRFSEPSAVVSFANFAPSFAAHVGAYARLHR